MSFGQHDLLSIGHNVDLELTLFVKFIFLGGKLDARAEPM